jgi:molecular chaperone HtpG
MLQIPTRLKSILDKDIKLNGFVLNTISTFGEILKENKLFFFEEFTDHGIEHIQNVLKASEEVITEKTIELLKPNDVALLVLAVVLHDLGMHTSLMTFNRMIEGSYDDVRVKEFDDNTWKELWETFLDQAKKFSGKQRFKIFGDEHYQVRRPNLSNKGELTENDKKLIGEFIRRHHPRIAHEIAIKGLLGKKNELIELPADLDQDYKDLAGLIARSHGIDVRETFSYLEKLSEQEWARPYSLHIIFLMIVIRIADYFQFDSSRVSNVTLKLKTFSSPISQLEHVKHSSIKFVKEYNKDNETLIVEANPPDSYIYLNLKYLFTDIQNELDKSWAILGEIYGKEVSERKPNIKYRRIKSNLERNSKFTRSLNYVPEKIAFVSDEELPKLLIAPLYGNDPSYGVRELLQNSIDACRERQVEASKTGETYHPLITITVQKENDKFFFEIEDNGRGMSLFELQNYFLKAGASFRRSADWQKKYTNNEGKSIVLRSGKFGVGVLAAFLLGEEIMVNTKSIYEKQGYSFTADVDKEQIEINKEDGDLDGTRIKIYLAKETYDSLVAQVDYEGENLKRDYPTESWISGINIKWCKWYTLATPIINYSVNNQTFVSYKHTDSSIDGVIPNDWNYFNAEGFDKILWTYSKKYNNALLTCNGIIIPNGYELRAQNYGQNIINPKISIFDTNGSLDLNLNRNSLSNNKLPFEEKLVTEIYKDIIGFILGFKNAIVYENNKININANLLNHPALSSNSSWRNKPYSQIDLLYTRDGFLLNEPYSLSKLNYSHIHTFYFKEDFEGVISLPAGVKLFQLSFLEGESVGELYNPLDFINGGRVTVNNSVYEKMFNAKTKNPRVRRGLKNDHIVEKRDSKRTTYSYLFDKPSKYKTSDFGASINNLLIIKEENLYYFPKESQLFQELISKYLGDDPEIPNNIEVRKRKFANAFSELEPYIRKYISN